MTEKELENDAGLAVTSKSCPVVLGTYVGCLTISSRKWSSKKDSRY